MKYLLLALGLVLLLVVSGVALLSKNWQKTPLVDFANLSQPETPNYCLLYQKNQPPRLLRAPTFAIDTTKLRTIWLALIKQTPRSHLLRASENHFQYVIYSKIFGFPDLVDVQIVQKSPEHSQIYIYSRAVYGYSDFEVNTKRVQAWLKIIRQRIKA